MRYLDLTKEAKQTALEDYCDLMGIMTHQIKDWEARITRWFTKHNKDLFNEDGKLTNRIL